MRAACEIVADLKDGKEVPYEELKNGLLSAVKHNFLLSARYKEFIKGWYCSGFGGTNEL